MRIIALSDIHGAYKKVDEILAQESSFDALIIAGDLTTVGPPEEAASAIRQFLRHGKPLFVVAGNMDVPEVEATFSTLGVSVNARGVVLEGVGIFGVSASPFTPMHTPYEISEDEIMTRAEAGWKDVASAQRKLFVPHAPPRETKVDRILLGKHVGSTAVRTFIERYAPDVVICGHIHEARGIDTIGTTTIVNCGPAGKGYYVVIELGEEINVELRG